MCKNHKKIKFFFLIIFVIAVIFMVTPVLSSCNEPEVKNKEITKTEENPTNADVDDANGEADASSDKNEDAPDILQSMQSIREKVKDDVPDDLDFGGRELRILHRGDGNALYGDGFICILEITAAEENGDVINDAVYRRNQAIEEKLNIKIKPIEMFGADWNESFFGAAQKSVKAGNDDFDLIFGYAALTTQYAMKGIYYNARNLPYIDMSKPWWNQNFNQEFTIEGKQYLLAGDYSLSMLSRAYCIYFNRKYANALNIENLYDTVLNGDWTLDKISELTKYAYRDLNGNGIKDAGDRFGFVITGGTYVDNFLFSYDQPITVMNSEGLPELAVNTPKMAEIVSKTYDFFYNNIGTDMRGDEGTELKNLEDFSTDNILFLPNTLLKNELLRSAETEYGILPYPKWDKAQEKYYTGAQDNFSIISVLATIKDEELVGAALEALAAESYRKVTPAYYEIALKRKYLRDDESAEMLDIISGGLSFNFGGFHSENINGIRVRLFRQLMADKKSDFVSAYDKYEANFQKGLDKVIAAYQKLD